MKGFSLLLKVAIIISASAISASTMATICSSRTTPVCVEPTDLDSDPQDTCVSNAGVVQYLASDREFTLMGKCTQFSMKKIRTYACNAGLRLVKPTKIICIKLDENNTVADSCGDSQNCICNSNDAEDEVKTNYFNYGISPYSKKGFHSFKNKTRTTSNNMTFASAASTSGREIIQDNSALQFNFGSDFYGAEYYVDICVRNSNLNPGRASLTYAGNLLFGNSIFNAINYNNSSTLFNRSELICGGSGTQTIITDSPFLSGQRNFNRSGASARLCVVRHHFRETAKNKLRGNNFKKVTFQTSLSVTPTDPSITKETPIEYCKIIETTPKKYKCTPFIASSTEDLISSGFVDENTYTGACPEECKPF